MGGIKKIIQMYYCFGTGQEYPPKELPDWDSINQYYEIENGVKIPYEELSPNAQKLVEGKRWFHWMRTEIMEGYFAQDDRWFGSHYFKNAHHKDVYKKLFDWHIDIENTIGNKNVKKNYSK